MMASILPRFFIVCALGVLLTACNYSRGNQNMFDSPPRAQKDRALVIVGLSGRPNQFVPTATMVWKKENASSLRDGHHIIAFRHCNGGGATWCEKPATTYHISIVEPGTYTLAWAQWSKGRRQYKTTYSGDRPMVTVRAGEIVYIGDFMFNFQTHPIRPYGVALRPRAALKALMKQSRGNPGGPMKIRRPRFADWRQKSANEPR